MVEAIEIFRRERAPEAMAAVKRACERLTAEEIVRGGRTLRSSVIHPQ